METTVTKRLRLYSDRSFLPDGVPHAAILEPFWGASGVDPETQESFRRYRESGASMFDMVSFDEADIAVLPYDWTYATWDAHFSPVARERAVAFAQGASDAGKPVVVFYETDAKLGIPFENILFCTDLEGSSRRPTEFALPGWSEDLLTKYQGGTVPVRQRGGRPTVGFCGFAPPLRMPLGRAKAKEVARHVVSRTGVMRLIPVGENPSERMRRARTSAASSRVQAIRVLGRSRDVDTNFLIRAHKTHPKGGRWKRPAAKASLEGGRLKSPVNGVHVQRNLQLEYLTNTLESDYVLCSRGFGNFSYRFYETLASGRIPVLIDTDCVLPYDFAIDWNAYCVRVPERDVRQIGGRVAEFHEALSPSEFQDLQMACRKLWEEWLSPEGFFANFHRHFDTGSAARVQRHSSP